MARGRRPQRLFQFGSGAAFRNEAVATRRQYFEDRIPVTAICRDQNVDRRPHFAEPSKPVDALHARKVEVNNGQIHTRAILSQDSRKFPEIPAGQDFGKVEAGLHDVEQPRAAKRIVIGYNRNLGVPSHLPAPVPQTGPPRACRERTAVSHSMRMLIHIKYIES